jgi:hypothetical protein
MVLKVIADTSFLMIPGIFKVDIRKELDRLIERRYEILVPKPVVAELERLIKEGTPRERVAAKIGMEITKRGRIVEVGKNADDAIVELANGKDVAVGTTDAGLKKRLRKIGVLVIFLRQKSHLTVDGQLG